VNQIATVDRESGAMKPNQIFFSETWQ
jgi:hypothetical protein